jgi:hypothetical protein
MLFYFIFEINILINEFNYEKFQHFFLVSLLSGVVTLGSYKLLFDTNGYFSNENGLVTMASNSYGKEWVYQLMFLTLLRLPKNNSFRCSRKNVSRPR